MDTPGEGDAALNLANVLQRIIAPLRRQARGAHAPRPVRAGIDWSTGSEGFGPENWTMGKVQPYIDIHAASDEVRVVMEIAGARPGDIRVSVADRMLLISGERWPVDTPENENDEERGLPYEVRFGQFRRTLRLPFEVERDNIREHWSNDVVEIIFQRQKAGR